MFAPLIFGCIAVYMFIGWIAIAALDRRIARQRRGGMLWVAMFLWPITIVVDLFSRGGSGRP
jgi:hypothetical protein